MRNIFFFLFYFITLSTSEDVKFKVMTSQFDLHEVENFKYNFEIQNEPINKDELSSSSLSSFLSITNIYGQLYGCNLTDVFNALNQINDVNTDKPAYNFTYIKTELDRILGELNKTNVCITKNQGWWSYEFCFGKYIHQFHVLSNSSLFKNYFEGLLNIFLVANGSISEPIINLGNYSSDWNWLQTNESNLLRLDNKLFHEQYFDLDGSLCELLNKPRRTTVKFICDEMTLNHIDSINEIETCVYEIHIHSSNLCSIKNFNKKYQNSNIKCNPLLNQNDYEQYMNNRVKVVTDEIKEEEEEDNDLLINQLNEDLMNNEEKIKGLKEKTKYYENLINSKTTDNDEVNLVDEIKNTEMELMKSADSLLKTNEMLKKLTDNLNDIIDNLDVDRNVDTDDSFDIVDVEGDDSEASESTKKTSTTTTPSSLIDSKEAKSTNDIKFKVSVLDANSDVAKEMKKLTGLDDQVDNAKSLERSIREKLMNKNSKFKDIEVKIISLDGSSFNTNNINSESVSKLISSLFGDAENKETLSNLNKNYNLVYNNNIGEFTNRDEKNGEEEKEELFIRY